MNRRMFAVVGAGALLGRRSVMAQPGTPVVTEGGVDALYRIDLPGDSFPNGPMIAGVVAVSMTAGTTVSYPAGGSPESLAIDHVLVGEYTMTTGSDTLQYGPDGDQVDIPAGEQITVRAGESLVLVDNEAEQEFVVGDVDTETLTVGFFTLEQGTGESTVNGDLVAEFLGGSQPVELPDQGITVLIVPAQDDENAWPDAVIRAPFETGDGTAWELVVLPLEGDATPVVVATPAS